MKKFLMHQESGFLWDLYFVFYLKFNYQGLSEKKMTSKKTAEYIELYRETQLWFGDLPEDLGVFFRVAEMQGKSFFESCLLKSFENDFINKYNVEFLQQELLDHNRVVEKMISFYLDELGDQQVAECLNSKEVLFEQIKASSYSVKEKLELYEFFINPATYIILLRRTLTEKQSLLSEYYKTHYKDIIGAYDPAELNKLNEKMKSKMQDQSKQEKTGYVSYCLLDRFHYQMISNDGAYLYVMGKKYEAETECSTQKNDSHLGNFGYALCEKNRIDILNMLCEQKEATCKDLERYFDFSGSTAYHHLSILSKAGLLKTKNKGKTIYYSIDKSFMKDIMELLKKYTQ